MVESSLFDKTRGQRMLLTKWIRNYNSTDDPDEQELAIQKLASVLAWARSVGMSPSDIAEDRDLPHRAIELFQGGMADPTTEVGEEDQAAKEVASSVDISEVIRDGVGSSSVYAYGYACAPDRLKVGRTDGDVINRIVRQINTSTPDRPSLRLVLSTDRPRALENALHGALALRGREVDGGGAEWFRTTVDEVLAIYRMLVTEPGEGTREIIENGKSA